MTTFGSLIGTELGPSGWIDVSQERIDSFAEATNDHQWIHVDRERAASRARRRWDAGGTGA